MDTTKAAGTKVRSFNDKYWLTLDSQGVVTWCECLGWKYSKPEARECRHARKVRQDAAKGDKSPAAAAVPVLVVAPRVDRAARFAAAHEANRAAWARRAA